MERRKRSRGRRADRGWVIGHPPALFQERKWGDMEDYLAVETLVIELLVVVTLVQMGARRLRIPYTVALVLVGLFLTLQQPFRISLAPELLLILFIPPLVFEAGFHLRLDDLRHDLPGVLLLAVPGVLVTMLIVGGLVTLATPLSLPLGLVFGALISATDPISVVAAFRAIGVPRRLQTLIEGESLFNDGTSIVIFRIALAAALTGNFSLLSGAGEFLRVALGGIALGIFLGWIVAQIIARIDDYLIEITLTTLLAFGSYLLAERLSFSGVLAVAAAGLVNGNIGPRGMSPTTRIVLFNFWEYVAFLANSLVFLLIGLQIDLQAVILAWVPIAAAVAAVLISRAVVIYGMGFLGRRSLPAIPLPWQHVLTWGGLRGAVSLALVLSLPVSMGSQRTLLQAMAFGVVLFTLLVQGISVAPLARWLKVGRRDELAEGYELEHARLTALRAAASRLDQLYREGLIAMPVWEALQSQLADRVDQQARQVRELVKSSPELEAEELNTARRELLRAERSALSGLLRDGVISKDVFDQLAADVDGNLVSLEEVPLE